MLLKLHHYTYETTTDVVGLHQLFKQKEGNDDWISQKLIYLCKKIWLLSFFRIRVDDKSGIFQVNTNQSTEWTHLVLVYVGPNKGQGIRVAINVNTIIKDKMSDDSSTQSGNGHATIGTQVTNENPELFYASVKVDELTFWNRTLSLIEVMTILDMHCKECPIYPTPEPWI